MFHLALQRVLQLALLRIAGQVEVVVVVGDEDVTKEVDADADRVVGQPDGS